MNACTPYLGMLGGYIAGCQQTGLHDANQIRAHRRGLDRAGAFPVEVGDGSQAPPRRVRATASRGAEALEALGARRRRVCRICQVSQVVWKAGGLVG